MKRLRAIVTGRVQGVWFRARTRDEAVRLGVVGYVRNLADGTVEIVAQGDEGSVDALMAWARQGPPMANVLAVDINEVPGVEEFVDFEVRW